MKYKQPCFVLLFLLTSSFCIAQVDTSSKSIPRYKNVIRYNLSSALIFGIDKYVVFGYERVIRKNQSISVNVGGVALPKLVSIKTDSFSLQKDTKNNSVNFSVDYRFYLGKENKYPAPRGVYIGPYYAYNKFTRDNQWLKSSGTTSTYVNTHSVLNINTIGFEFGYQFILWKRLALDLVLVGPGYAIYNYKVTSENSLTAQQKDQLYDALQQLLEQKFPGMNYVMSDEQFNSNGVLRTNSIGYRYMIHIGFAF
ncbi:MAG: DUF3575 domain-containing protein [Bacteroidetes bacterium]|nr:MAG: DUF3575 domain-containing protein [Bacteroidota bacterium]